ncbi:MAG: hypothetical protein FWF78_10050 [Defluviitaleaceae bacterium]|nr:hypothetical protein [Defluviitaleaceae bacterium]
MNRAENLRREYESDSHSICITDDDIAIITIPTMGNDNLPKEFFSNLSMLKNMKGFVVDHIYRSK